MAKILHLKVYLEDMPHIWRRIALPNNMTFDELHHIILHSMGWSGHHLYAFMDKWEELGEGEENIYLSIPSPEGKEMYGDRLKDSRKIKVTRYFKNPGDYINYEYDFGDSWKHKVKLEEITNMDEPYVDCEGGMYACPPDDVGGVGGYFGMLDIFKKGSEDDKRSYLDWLGLTHGDTWHEEAFNRRDAQCRLDMWMKYRRYEHIFKF